MSHRTTLPRLVGMFLRVLMLAAGIPLVAGGLGMTMIGVLAFLGVPLLIVGLGLISGAVSPDR